MYVALIYKLQSGLPNKKQKDPGKDVAGYETDEEKATASVSCPWFAQHHAPQRWELPRIRPCGFCREARRV